MSRTESSRALADTIAAQFELQCRPWFGGWSLRRRGEQIAIVMDTLYLRVDDDLRAELDSTGRTRPFRYRRRDGREIEVDAYRAVPPALLADPPALDRLLRRLDRPGDSALSPSAPSRPGSRRARS